MSQEREKEFTANTYNELGHNYLRFHEAGTTSPCSTLFWSLPQQGRTGHTTFNPTNNITFGTQGYFPSCRIYQQGLGQYLNWMYLNQTNLEDQSSLEKYGICEFNKRRPSVIQSVGQVPPLSEAGSNISLTDDLSLPLHSLDVSYNKWNNEGSDTRSVMLKEKQTCEFKNLSYKDKNRPGPSQQGDADRCMRQWSGTNSGFEPTEGRKYRFHCRFCNKPYHWRSHWKAHERIHTGERPFKCDICGKAFTRSDGLQCHQHTHFRKKESTVSLSKSEYDLENNSSAKDETLNDSCDNSSVQVKSLDGGKEYMKNRLDVNAISLESKNVLHCQLCKKGFFSSNGLQHHLRQHNKMKDMAKSRS